MNITHCSQRRHERLLIASVSQLLVQLNARITFLLACFASVSARLSALIICPVWCFIASYQYLSKSPLLSSSCLSTEICFGFRFVFFETICSGTIGYSSLLSWTSYFSLSVRDIGHLDIGHLDTQQERLEMCYRFFRHAQHNQEIRIHMKGCARARVCVCACVRVCGWVWCVGGCGCLYGCVGVHVWVGEWLGVSGCVWMWVCACMCVLGCWGGVLGRGAVRRLEWEKGVKPCHKNDSGKEGKKHRQKQKIKK